tara:strand:+ start:2025 stop:2366 length:342 start_codon:yes stop_codon:yes gene_type:complete
MSNPINKMTGHFRNKISGAMQSVEVPEWDLKIYYKASNTLAEEAKLIELAQNGKTVEALVETLITKACNEDGTKMFKKIDKPAMMNEVDPVVLIKVVGEMNADDSNIEYAEKN